MNKTQKILKTTSIIVFGGLGFVIYYLIILQLCDYLYSLYALDVIYNIVGLFGGILLFAIVSTVYRKVKRLS